MGLVLHTLILGIQVKLVRIMFGPIVSNNTLILCIQLGYKVASRQLVYILSPCHAVTTLQVNGLTLRTLLSSQTKFSIYSVLHKVFLMAAPPSPSTSIIFQAHLGLLNGAVLALIFPVLDTYIMPGEVNH